MSYMASIVLFVYGGRHLQKVLQITSRILPVDQLEEHRVRKPFNAALSHGRNVGA